MKHLTTTIFASASLLLLACGNESGSKAPKGPEPTPKPVVVVAQPTIASVQLIQDCPDPKVADAKEKPSAVEAMADAPMPAQPPAKGASAMRRSKPGPGGFQQPCTQSSMQVAFAGQGEASSQVEVKAVRLLSADGESLGVMNSRLPTVWQAESYQPWDGVVAPNTDIKTSYKLSMPDWKAVEEKLGGTSFGPMFMLEVDVMIGDQLKTIKSPQFPRQQPAIIVT